MPKSVVRIFAALLLFVALPAMAQSDPPSRVGRLSHLEGEVSFQVDPRDEGGPATLNWPVSSGAVLSTGRPGRAEVWIGSTAYRLKSNSEVVFPVVDDHRVDIRLSGGSLAVSVLDREQADDVEIETPDGIVRFQAPGRYRINVQAEHSELLVQAGRATFDDGRRSLPVSAGQMATLGRDGERLDAIQGYDAFDQWVGNRENAALAAQARRYVSPYMTGYQDLDSYGDWRNTSDYGAVWYPRAVAADWAPYRFGRWAWVAPWGWTWIDAAPWGFAPFHYGRWAMIAGRWAWVPGRPVPRPVYAPALVGWVGDPGWSVSFSFGAAPAVGWFPLAPREVFVPAYRYSPHYVRQVNVGHVHDIHVVDRSLRGAPPAYAYRAVAQAVTVVPSSHLREGRPISAGDWRPADRHDLGRAPSARQAPTAQWLAPTAGAQRPHQGEPQRREFEGGRPNVGSRDMPRVEGMPRDGERPALRQPPASRERLPAEEGRRSQPDSGLPDMRREERRRLPEAQPGAVAPTDAGREMAGESRRELFRRQPEVRGGEMPADMRRPDRPQPIPTQQRERPAPPQVPAMAPQRPPEALPSPMPQRREMPAAEARPAQPDGSFRRPVEARPEVERASNQPDMAPGRREMRAPEMRREDRPQPAFQPPEREPRREMRDVQREAPREMPRFERPAAPLAAPSPMPQAMPQREVPRPAPEVRMPAPPPAVPQPAPPPRAEPPRQPVHQGGGNEPQRRRDEERERR